jgi:hypothetical protein
MTNLILPAGMVLGEENGWQKIHNPAAPPGSDSFVNGLLVAIRGRELCRWHLSVSHRQRIPTWEELGNARDALIPKEAWMMVPHPPREYWMNFNRRVLHLWEFNDSTLIEQFKFEGEVAREMGVNIPDGGT